MINEARFPQPWIEEPEDLVYEINPCVTKSITDYPKEIQERIQAYKGSRKVTQKRFNIANKVGLK